MSFSVLSAILSMAMDNGELIFNPCHGRRKKVYRSDRREKIWTEDAEKRFLAVAPPPIQVAFLAALWTGQRQGDLIDAKLADYDGDVLRVRQNKTGARVAI